MTNPTPTRADVEALAQLARGGALMGAERHAIADALDAYAATLPPQAAPVAEGKPDFEKEAAAFLKSSLIPATPILTKEMAAFGHHWWTAAAQKAALEAEARCAEMRDALVCAEEYITGKGLNLALVLRVVRALPQTGDRFMRLLEAVRAHENHWMPLDVRNALAAFPQPEEKP